MSGLQQEDGSFFGDEWGEVDTRFSYCALSSMAILGQLDSGKIDVKKAAEFVGRFDLRPAASCIMNFAFYALSKKFRAM